MMDEYFDHLLYSEDDNKNNSHTTLLIASNGSTEDASSYVVDSDSDYGRLIQALFYSS
ncbi:hypothetical protein CsatB_009898 [Cannabis sativa]